MGTRLLKRWLVTPYQNRSIILARQAALQEIIENNWHHSLHEILSEIGDIERALSRIALLTARPRDLIMLKQALNQLPLIQQILGSAESTLISNLKNSASALPEIQQLLERAIIAQPPLLIRDGGVIASGYDQELDELRNLAEHSDDFLLKLEARERERSGLNTLKVGYNRIHGYYIEISRLQAKLAPADYTRRQTLKNVERYITPELKEFEDKILSSFSRALAREKYLYEQLLLRLQKDIQPLFQIARVLAEFDVLATLAERIQHLNFKAAEFVDEEMVEIQQGRHPVVASISREAFIPNDTYLTNETRMQIITGPNMGGKSTYMRQVALITLLVHICGYAPAQKMRFGKIDRIFTRLGASDDLAQGQSTFMLEMTQTANILKNASKNSLVIIDEIGRGTSTSDGVALAWAIAEYLACEKKSYTLFATHFFELTQLAHKYPAITNVHVSAAQIQEHIVFLHEIEPGPANASYGIEVAQLAGLPLAIIHQAKQFIRQENQINEPIKAEKIAVENDTKNQLKDKISHLNLLTMTPIDALICLQQLKQMIEKN